MKVSLRFLLKEWGWSALRGCSTLLQGVKAGLYPEEGTSFDSAVRRAYAFAVGRAIFRGRDGKDLIRLFVHLRMERVWGWANNPGLIWDLWDLLKRDPMTGPIVRSKEFWYLKNSLGLNVQGIVLLAAKGWSPKEIYKFSRTVARLRSKIRRGRYPGLRSDTLGEKFFHMCRTISAAHRKYAATYFRCMKYFLPVSLSITGRYLRVLGGLSEKSLRYTLTDRRNWVLPNYGDEGYCNSFRLSVVIKSLEEWQPFRGTDMRERFWLVNYGRKPLRREIYFLPVDLVALLGKKGFGFLVKETRALEEGLREELSERAIRALARVVLLLGPEYRKRLHRWTDPNDLWSLLDIIVLLGDELPNSWEDLSGIQSFCRKERNLDLLLSWGEEGASYRRILKEWDAIRSMGVNPLEKDGVRRALAGIEVLGYVEAGARVKRIELALEAAKFSLDPEEFNRIQERWIQGLDSNCICTLPMVDFTIGKYRCRLLPKDDPRGIFLGQYTGCCQHPTGAGSSCAWYGHENPNSGFLVVEKGEKILAQSWIWQKGDTLVFDNIEGVYGDREVIGLLYLEAMSRFGSWGRRYRKFVVGVGDLNFQWVSERLQDGSGRPEPPTLPEDYVKGEEYQPPYSDVWEYSPSGWVVKDGIDILHTEEVAAALKLMRAESSPDEFSGDSSSEGREVEDE